MQGQEGYTITYCELFLAWQSLLKTQAAAEHVLELWDRELNPKP